MAALIHLPEELQRHISDFLRPHRFMGGVGGGGGELKIDPMATAMDVANIKAVHRNFKDVQLWKKAKWVERICKWRDDHLTVMRWEYQFGVLPDKMIKAGWVRKINEDYRHQNCFVKSGVLNIIWFEVCVGDLIGGIRPLPSCFGKADDSIDQASRGSLQATIGNGVMVDEPTMDTLIPKKMRRALLRKCFKECILDYYPNKDFIKGFKKTMDLPSGHCLTVDDLYRMFLKTLGVHRGYMNYDSRTRETAESESIDEICRGEN